MSDLSLIPLQDWYESQLSQDWDGNTGTVYVLSTPSYTPTTTNTYIVVNPWKTNMQIAEITDYDSTAKTLTVSSISFEKGLGTSSTAQTHTTGSKVIISDNYQFWEDIKTAINSKLDKTGGNALIYADTTARDTALWANGVPTTPYTNIYVTATGLFYNYNLSTAQWEAIDTGTTPWNATNVSAGLVRSDVAPAGIPVALIQDNPKYDALAGTSGTPSSSNKYVTNDDTTGTGSVVRSSALVFTSFGDGSDGTVTINSGSFTSGPITSNALTRDAYFQDLTIQTTRTLDTNGFRLFVKGTLTFEGTAKLINNGGNGGNGTAGTVGAANGVGGTAGAAAATGGSLPDSIAGVAGGDGADAATGAAGSNGTAGIAAEKSLGSVGVIGATGGSGGTAGAGTGPGAGGGAGAAGAQTGTVFNKMNSIVSGYYLIDNQPTIVTLTGSSGSGGSGGGGGGRSTNGADCGAGGGGGGSGATGGIVWVAAKDIVTVDGNNYITATGGNGGNGGAGGTSTGNNGGGGGGGGSGSGGSGGVVILYYYTKTGTGTISVAGGTAGTVGAAGGAHGTGTVGNAGAAGTAGATGQSYVISIA